MGQATAVVAGSVVLALATALPHAQTSQRPSARRTQQVYVSVLDRDNKPVANLGPADFVVREDNVAREVLSATPATEPLTIAVTVDDSQSATHAIQFFRDGLTNFVKKLDGKGEIALSTVGDRPTPLVEYTTSTAQLQKGIGRLFSRPGSGAYLLEALVELSKGLEKRTVPEGEASPRRAIVVLTMESGPEFSNLHYERVLDALKKSGATLHVLAIGNPALSDTDEMKNRNIVIAEGTSLTGGRRDQILAESGISDRLSQLADELMNQYLVTYSRPETLIPPEKLDVSVSKPGLTVRAPKRTAAR